MVDWSKNIFVRNAKLYEQVLEGMWERGEEDAVAIAAFLEERGLGECRILDVPCGIGRVGIPLARLGFRVEGLDLSPHLVDVASEKARRFKVTGRAVFRKGDMRAVHSVFSRDSFDVAINVFTSIGYGSEGDDLEFFRSVRGVMKAGGLLLISGLRNRDYIERNPTQNIYEENGRLLVLDRYRFDSAKSREEGSWRFYERQDDGRILKFAGEFPISVRLYSPHELVPRLGETGWKVTETFDSFITRRTFRRASPVYSLVARAI